MEPHDMSAPVDLECPACRSSFPVLNPHRNHILMGCIAEAVRLLDYAGASLADVVGPDARRYRRLRSA
jgi:hypothetical protein